MKILVKLNKSGEIMSNLSKDREYELVGFYAKSNQYIGTHQEGLPVYSIYEAVEMYKQSIVSTLVINGNISLDGVKSDVRALKSYGVQMNDILVALPEFIEHGGTENLVSFREYHRLPYMEYHVADHCNLNCRGCVHFSPLAGKDKFPVYEHMEKDLRQLKKIVSYIDKIRILGGEPLLNPELPLYMKLTREVYPYATISIVTNGLLLSTIDFWDYFIKYRINVDISLYKPIFNKAGKMMKMLQEKGIVFSISEPIEEFSYALDKNSGHARFAYRHNCSCPNLYEGGVYVCPIIAYVKYFNHAFNYQFNDNDGKIDIYDRNMDFTRLNDELHKVRKMCDNCLYISGEHIVTQPWSQTTKAKASDYMI